MNVETIIVRHSPVMAVFRLIVFLVVLSLIFAAAFSFLEGGSFDISGQLQMLHLELFIVYAVLSILITLIVMLRWAFDWYAVREGLMVHRRGIIFRKTTGTSLQHVEEISVREGFFGRLLKHGTVVLHNPLWKEEVTLDNIMDPITQARTLRNAIGKAADTIVPLPE